MAFSENSARGAGLLKTERDMEMRFRSVICPTCLAWPGEACLNTVDAKDKHYKRWTVSHWRRKEAYEEGT